MQATKSILKLHAAAKKGALSLLIFDLQPKVATQFLQKPALDTRQAGRQWLLKSGRAGPGWCLRYANGDSKPLPQLNHQISIPSKGSSARWFGGSFLLHFRGHSVVNLCAYRNLYSWEIPSTKRLDCLGGLIGTPFGDDDQRFVYIKMLQFLLLGLGTWICFDNKRQ